MEQPKIEKTREIVKATENDKKLVALRDLKTIQASSTNTNIAGYQ
jgi:hypothetical protein